MEAYTTTKHIERHEKYHHAITVHTHDCPLTHKKLLTKIETNNYNFKRCQYCYA